MSIGPLQRCCVGVRGDTVAAPSEGTALPLRRRYVGPAMRGQPTFPLLRSRWRDPGPREEPKAGSGEGKCPASTVWAGGSGLYGPC